jgi:hypothetical protein
MSQKNVLQVIHELSGDLTPVRPLPRLRSAASGVAVLWLAVAVFALASRGLRPDLLQALGSGRAFLVIVVGLGLVGIGGVVAALAVSVPGRGTAVRVGLGFGLAGVLLASGVGAVLVVREAGTGPWACPTGSDLACFAVACLLALPPALGVLAFVSRGSPFRPLLAVLTATTAAVALGATLVQLTCPGTSPRHVIFGHALAPFVGALLLTLPFHAALKRVTRT